jgi:hypothetical protein
LAGLPSTKVVPIRGGRIRAAFPRCTKGGGGGGDRQAKHGTGKHERRDRRNYTGLVVASLALSSPAQRLIKASLPEYPPPVGVKSAKSRHCPGRMSSAG